MSGRPTCGSCGRAMPEAPRLVTAAERRARLGVRHLLAAEHRAADAATVADALVALHATDPSTVYLSAAARLRTASLASTERALYDDRTLVRLLGMRRTMFVCTVPVAGVVQSSSTDALAPKLRRDVAKLVVDGGVADDGERWLTEVADATVALLHERGTATTNQLSSELPALRAKAAYGASGATPAGEVGVANRVMTVLGAEGRILRGRPKGSWVSSQYEWAATDTWVPGGLPRPPADEARAELVRRWLARFGPGTEADVKWWTGWSLAHVRKALAALGAARVLLDDGATGYVLPDDLDDVPEPAPWAALLPSLDPTPMGWTERGWYLGTHRDALFDRSGNIGPTVWWAGRIVGGWGQRPDGAVVHRLLEDVGAEGRAAVDDAAGAIEAVLAGVRVMPRFPTPLQRELSR